MVGSTLSRIALSFLVFVMVGLASEDARAENCDCVSIAADVPAAVTGIAVNADNLFAQGNYAGALALYADGYAKSKAEVFLYAQGYCYWRLGKDAEAAAAFKAFLAAGGAVMAKYKLRAEAALAAVGAGAVAGGAAAGGKGVVGGVVGGVGGVVGGVVPGADGVVDGTVDGAVGAVGGVAGGVTGALDAGPKKVKVAKGAAILLGVVAVGALGAVAIHGIGSLDEDVEFDGKFGLGLGLSGAVVGGTAIYLWGLTTTVGAAGALNCAQAPRRIIAPVAHRGGAGVSAAFTF